MSSHPEFKYPEDFASLKGRGNRFYCKLCTPPGYNQGQAMTLTTAIRHETENKKHGELAEAAHPVVHDAWDDDWEDRRQAYADWGPQPIPEGSSPWEESYPADRVSDLIPWWRKGVVAAMNNEQMESMDQFIDWYNEKYYKWAEDTYKDTWGVAPGGNDAEGGESQWDGVAGQWYTGGSFLPHEDGCFEASPERPETQQPAGADENAPILGGNPEDPCAVWGVTPDEVTPWTTSAGQASGPGQSSATTLRQASANEDLPKKDSQRKSRPRRGGHRRGKQGAIVERATEPPHYWN